MALTAAVAPDAGSQQHSNLDSARANIRRLWYICLAPEVVRFLPADWGGDRELGLKGVQFAQQTVLNMGQCLGKPPGGMKPGQQPYHQNGGMGYQQNGYNNQYQQGQDGATEAVHGGFGFTSQCVEAAAV